MTLSQKLEFYPKNRKCVVVVVFVVIVVVAVVVFQLKMFFTYSEVVY